MSYRTSKNIISGLTRQKTEDGQGLLLATKTVVLPILLPRTKTHERPDDIGGCEPADERRLFEQIAAWEKNQLSQLETLNLFQELVACGLAWKSTGAVRRTASRFIREGRIKP